MAEWFEIHSQLVLLRGTGEVPPPEEWLVLYSRDLSLQGYEEEVPPTEEWVELYGTVLLLRAEGVPPVPPPPPPPEEVKFPWVPVALIGGGAVVAALAMKPKIKGA